MIIEKSTPNWGDYEEVMNWLFNQLPNYQAQGTSAYKPGLKTIQTLLAALDHPEENFKSIHIAGTNGKGSVAHMIAAVYQNNGYKTGVFTSPHITDFRERIKINGTYVSKDWVIDFLQRNYNVINDLEATFFEISTAMAFQYFADQKVDIAIIETGLGGRLDASNVLLPELSIITTVSKDHTQFLGEDLKSIASEKAGIIKKDIPVLLGFLNSEVKTVIKKTAKENNAQVHEVDEIADFDTDLKGNYQKQNLTIATKAIEILEEKFPINQSKQKDALKHVMELTNFKGRFQKIQKEPDVILDVAHNEAGVGALLNEISTNQYNTLHIVFGASSDKDLNTIFKLLPKAARYYLTEFDSTRSLKGDKLRELAEKHELNYSIYSTPENAYKSAKKESIKSDLILIFGSIFLMQAIFNLHE